MGSFFKKHPGFALILFNGMIFIVLILLIEFALKKCAPFNIATVGHKFCENAKLYGWGFSPHEQLRNYDADTGQTYRGTTNNHGWRDRDRDYENKNRAYRIVVLGDSIAFGGGVSAQGMYTSILEKKLFDEGYNVEVINISYGGWGTDQVLEAIKNEALRYKPNLIIVEFATNDPGDSSYFQTGPADKKDWKPFYYEVDEKNVLTKKVNPYFHIEPHGIKEHIKNLYSHDSEILKRLWAVYLIQRFQHLSSGSGYRVTNNKLLQLETVIGLQKTSPLYQSLKALIGKHPSLQEINQLLETVHASKEHKEIVRRILEDRLIADLWSKESYFPQPVNKEAYEYRLYFALMSEIQKQVRGGGADLAIFPNLEEGDYQEARYWYLISEDPIAKKNYFSPKEVVKSHLKTMGIDVIDNTIPYTRARNDSHPNLKGNQAMAEDIWKYLMLSKKKELDAHRVSLDVRR